MPGNTDGVLTLVVIGLPGSVGSIFVSRLSTALHAAALLPSSNTSGPHKSEYPSHSLVMITLLLITLPVEVIFLAALRGLGWLSLPFVFAVFSIIFFCCAVSSLIILPYLSVISTHLKHFCCLGYHITYRSPLPSELPVVKATGSRYIRTSYSLCPNGSGRSAAISPLFWNCIKIGTAFTHQNKQLMHLYIYIYDLFIATSCVFLQCVL